MINYYFFHFLKTYYAPCLILSRLSFVLFRMILITGSVISFTGELHLLMEALFPVNLFNPAKVRITECRELNFSISNYSGVFFFLKFKIYSYCWFSFDSSVTPVFIYVFYIYELFEFLKTLSFSSGVAGLGEFFAITDGSRSRVSFPNWSLFCSSELFIFSSFWKTGDYLCSL